MKKIITAILALALVAVFAGCAEKEDVTPSADNGVQAEVPENPENGSGETAETEIDYLGGLSKEKYDGYNFRILTRKGKLSDQYLEDESADIVESATYKRNKLVEEMYGITIIGSESSNSDYETDALNSILAGDDAYDLIFAHSRAAFAYAVNGAAYNINEIESIHTEKPWWNKDIVESCNIGGKLYVLDGDISSLGLGATMCMFFNKNLFDELGFDYPYETVLDGEWTFDEFSYIAKKGGKDLNGDGVITPDADRYGFRAEEWYAPLAILYTGGQKIYDKDENGENREFIVVSDETYTFPAQKNGKTVTAWSDGTSIYAAGDSVSLAEISAKTFAPVQVSYAQKLADYDETKGQLVYFTNFDDTLGYTNLAAVEASHFSGNLTTINGRFAMLTKRDNVTAENGCGICFNTWAYDMAVVPTSSGATSFTYTDGTPILGKVTLVADIYVDYDNDEKPTAVYDAFSVQFPGEAETVIASSFRSEEARISKIDTSSGWVSLSTATVTVTKDITGFNRIGFTPTQGSLRKAYYSSVGMYVVPSNGLWLTDANGENREMVVTSGESYTFPSEKDGSGVGAWTDGESTYFAGEAARVSEVAAKTFAPCEADYSPLSLDVASMRTTGSQGIRIAGFVSTAIRNAADEYGFVVALASSFSGGDYSTLTMTNTEINKVSAASYIKGTQTDKIYIDARETSEDALLQFRGAALDDLGIYFTGIYTGVPETAAAYTTVLAGRPYVKTGGNYYYGAVVERSVYQVALAIKAKCEKNDTAVPQYVLSVIEKVESSVS